MQLKLIENKPSWEKTKYIIQKCSEGWKYISSNRLSDMLDNGEPSIINNKFIRLATNELVELSLEEGFNTIVEVEDFEKGLNKYLDTCQGIRERYTDKSNQCHIQIDVGIEKL